MRNIIRFFSYPVRYLLRHKVELYEYKLKDIRERQQIQIGIAVRRGGMTGTMCSIMTREIVLATKYERYIKKWSL